MRDSVIDVAGTRLGYREAGAGATVLFLHGAAGATWDPLLDQLSGAHRMLAPEHPGFGRGQAQHQDQRNVTRQQCHRQCPSMPCVPRREQIAAPLYIKSLFRTREAGFPDDVAEAHDLAGNETREQLCEIGGTGPRACALCSAADDIFLRIMGCLSMAVASFEAGLIRASTIAPAWRGRQHEAISGRQTRPRRRVPYSQRWSAFRRRDPAQIKIGASEIMRLNVPCAGGGRCEIQ